MLGAKLNEILQYDLYINTNLQNFIACRTSHALLSHMENYHKLSHHNFINKTVVDTQIKNPAQSKIV